MKKLIMALFLVVGLTAFAQENGIEKSKKDKMSSEQKAELYVKKMKLELDLNDKQVTEIKKITEIQIQKRESKKAELKAQKEGQRKIHKEKRVIMKTQMIDNQIAHKSEMKKILSAEQFTKWKKIQSDREEKMKDKIERKRLDKNNDL